MSRVKESNSVVWNQYKGFRDQKDKQLQEESLTREKDEEKMKALLNQNNNWEEENQ